MGTQSSKTNLCKTTAKTFGYLINLNSSTNASLVWQDAQNTSSRMCSAKYFSRHRSKPTWVPFSHFESTGAISWIWLSVNFEYFTFLHFKHWSLFYIVNWKISPGFASLETFWAFIIFSNKYKKYSRASYCWPVWNSGWPLPTKLLKIAGLIPSW